ncbi:MAG: apolipoprotein N-acyltransferase [Spirochaetaceae bacterium]|jgi:apolipoprotein N-acyltransferase|nr:apolipoprotein N-acyltransferase [Spirochaetaceae bacterium]
MTRKTPSGETVNRSAESSGTRKIRDFLTDIGLLALGIILFTLPQPNLLSVRALPFLAYFACIPVFILVRRVSWKTVWLYGILYGVGAYCFFTSWLATYHPMGLLLIAFLYGFQLMIAFPLLKGAAALFPRYGWLVQWLVWCGYEYVKTLGFAGFNYGLLGYSQWRYLPIIQIASVTGIWGVSALVAWPSGWFAGGLSQGFRAFPSWARKHLTSAVVWCAVFVGVLVFGFLSPVDYSGDSGFTVALIQNNTDPWQANGVTEYRRDLASLMRLSDEALASRDDIDLVVWPETAFVPRIEWHYRYRTNREYYELVEQLLHYLDSAPIPFVLGNDDGLMGYDAYGEYGAIDYNAVLLFKPGENVIPPAPERYRKMHLVPFTESFPYKKQFPWLYQMLLDADTHLWEIGHDPEVFTVGDLSFSSPICFEDTFGYIARRFVNNGAQAIINISNDAWSKSLACQYQHLSMAVYRSVENRIPSVRATASGQTSIVDPNGRVVTMAEPFTETWLTGTIPVRNMNRKTVYTRYGDFLGISFTLGSVIILITAGLIRGIRNKEKKGFPSASR